MFVVSKFNDLNNIIIPHFLNYRLLTQKAADFLLFKRVIELMNKNAHLTKEGLQQIINLKSSMNLGLSDVLKTNFIKTISIVRPIFFTTNIPDPN
jgi:hypothetical protein